MLSCKYSGEEKCRIQTLPIVPPADFNKGNFNFELIFSSLFFCFLPSAPYFLLILSNIEQTLHNISPEKIFLFKLWLKFPIDIVWLNGECWQVSASPITSWHASSCHLLGSIFGAINIIRILKSLINIKSLQYFNPVLHFKSYHMIFLNCVPLSRKFSQLDFFL